MKECLNDILAVEVIYRRKLADTETFSSLSYSLEKLGGCLELLVYDNSPEPMEPAHHDYPAWRIQYVHDSANPGVSKAYNEGYRIAQRLGKKWLLLLDQDTVFPEDALAVYCQGIEKCPQVTLFAPVLKAGEVICSPCRYLMRTGFHPKTVRTGIQMLQGKAVLNSGMLVMVDVFGRCGGFNERIRLDFADFAFNNRLRRHHETFCVLPIQCRHGFSGTGTVSRPDALRRFELFREGAANSVESFTDGVLYSLVVLKRCIRLTVQFRSFCFIKSLLEMNKKRLNRKKDD